MQIKGIQRILGILIAGFSLTLLPPIAVSLIYGDNNTHSFLISMAIMLALGIAAWLPVRSHRQELRFRDGFIIVVLIWTVMSAMAAIPFLISENQGFVFDKDTSTRRVDEKQP